MLSVSVGTDTRRNDRRVVHLDQPHLGIPREYLAGAGGDAHVSAYAGFLLDTALYYGARGGEEAAEEAVRKVLDLERGLAEISAPKEERRDADALYNPVKLSQVYGAKYSPNQYRQRHI